MKLSKILGFVLILCGIIGVLAFLQATDPDCQYTTSVFLQLRLCDEEFVGPARQLSILYCLPPIVLILFGSFLASRRK